MTRHEDIVARALAGAPNKEIAQALGISEWTVWSHLNRARKDGAQVPYRRVGSARSAVLELARAEVAPSEIAIRLGISRETVNYYLSRARKDGVDVPRFKRGCRRAAGHGFVYLEPDTVTRLKPDAARRGQTVAELVRALVLTVLDARLIDAVLDDREGADA